MIYCIYCVLLRPGAISDLLWPLHRGEAMQSVPCRVSVFVFPWQAALLELQADQLGRRPPSSTAFIASIAFRMMK